MKDRESIGRAIREEQEGLAERIVALQYALKPQRWNRLGDEGRDKSIRDAAYHLSYLVEALEASDPALFTEYVEWVQILFAGLDFSHDVLQTTLACTRDVLKVYLPSEHFKVVDGYLEAGIRVLETGVTGPGSHVEDDAPLSGLAGRYIEALLSADRNGASRMILEAVEEGVPVCEVYLHVFQPVQREIGRLWQTNQLSVAQEHYCTAATQLIMSQLYPRIFATERTGHRLVATCVAGELHEIGARMVADFFEMEGWDTYYLGANTPSESVLRTIKERQPDVLGLSATITMHVSDVRSLIQQVRSSDVGDGVKILVGGYPFNIAPELWRRIGADGFAPNAQEATVVARTWVGRP